MDKKNNIYNYQAPKSMNEETHFFLTKGRITLKAFLLRSLLAISVVISLYVWFENYWLPTYYNKLRTNDLGKLVMGDSVFGNSYNIFIYSSIIVSIVMLLFIIVQAVKRIHDTNKSGWFALVPLYNLVLLFSKGTDGNNDYGINPRKPKQVKYFDELEKDKKTVSK